MLKVKKIVSGVLRENCYVIYDSESLRAVIIDPGEDGTKIIREIEVNCLKPELVVNTHGHYDHVFSNNQVCSEFNVPLAIHKNDIEMLASIYKSPSLSVCIFKEPEILLKDNCELKLSFTTFRTMHTPGHTKGSVCLLFDNFLITGDTLFAGTIGRTDLNGGNYEEIMDSISRLKKLDSCLTILPGHGSCTTLANEIRHNSYLK
ncbi:MAG: MBL fold metallo-hydrolase [Endomicrobium sp.]|jgi:glyoxylase-like metal-dependent hydrolase (beta-lactamase superfamily II)|nr:MBL fold metallo-hydrolase [Endomicrobium sp.]